MPLYSIRAMFKRNAGDGLSTASKMSLVCITVVVEQTTEQRHCVMKIERESLEIQQRSPLYIHKNKKERRRCIQMVSKKTWWRWHQSILEEVPRRYDKVPRPFAPALLATYRGERHVDVVKATSLWNTPSFSPSWLFSSSLFFFQLSHIVFVFYLDSFYYHPRSSFVFDNRKLVFDCYSNPDLTNLCTKMCFKVSSLKRCFSKC